MTFTNTSTDFIVTAAVTAPTTTPASIQSLLGTLAKDALAKGTTVQLEIFAEALDVRLRDSKDMTGRADDYFTISVGTSRTVSIVDTLDTIYLVSSGAATKVRLLAHCKK